ncbi:MAG TPA: cupin domain-containing protein [Longimicrobiales bacterium]|nr:cupin domain-containing protein [Longimicrobiales bacterium]
MSDVESPRRVDKPWGHELIWAATEHYVGKVLVVRAGHALSLQYHERKDETLYLVRGELRFHVGPSADQLEEVAFPAGTSYRIVPGTLHRMEAITDVELLEASTPELDDVVRVEDRYGRA